MCSNSVLVAVCNFNLKKSKAALKTLVPVTQMYKKSTASTKNIKNDKRLKYFIETRDQNENYR